MSSVSGTPSITESPRQMTPAIVGFACGSVLFAAVWRPCRTSQAAPLLPGHAGSALSSSNPQAAPSQSKMKQSTLSMSFFLSSVLARRAAGMQCGPQRAAGGSQASPGISSRPPSRRAHAGSRPLRLLSPSFSAAAPRCCCACRCCGCGWRAPGPAAARALCNDVRPGVA